MTLLALSRRTPRSGLECAPDRPAHLDSKSPGLRLRAPSSMLPALDAWLSADPTNGIRRLVLEHTREAALEMTASPLRVVLRTKKPASASTLTG